MRILYGTVSEIVDFNTRLIKCTSDEGHGEYTVELLFSHHNIEPGDKVLIFLLSSFGFTSNFAIPFSKKNEHTLHNIKIFFTPDTIIELNQDSINIQKTYSESSEEESTEEEDSEEDSGEEKRHNYIYIDKNTITINKAMRSEIVLTDDKMSINKFNVDNEPVAYIDIEDDKITINKQGDSQSGAVIEITDDEFNVNVKKISLLSSSGGQVKIPGNPQASSTPKGGFSQILYCPFTGLPHTTDTLVSTS